MNTEPNTGFQEKQKGRIVVYPAFESAEGELVIFGTPLGEVKSHQYLSKSEIEKYLADWKISSAENQKGGSRYL